jgi:hypothetical protein
MLWHCIGVLLCSEGRKMDDRYQLRVESGIGVGDVFEIPEGESVIGRASTGNIRIRDQLVSRQHARLFCQDGVVKIENLSVFGTLVDNKKVTEPMVLRAGQRISLSADTTLMFAEEGAFSSQAPASMTDAVPSREEVAAAASGGQSGTSVELARSVRFDGLRKFAGTVFGKVRIHVISFVLTAVFLVGVRVFFPENSYSYQFFLNRSACQWLSLYAFLFGFVSLLFRFTAWLHERHMFERVVDGRVESGEGMVWKRCHRVEFYVDRVSPSELRNLAKDLAERDSDELSAEYTPIQDVIQMLPLLGFFGTVLGLSLGLNATFSGNENVATGNSFAKAIATAFDTTLLALACMIILTVLQRLVHRQDTLIFAKLGEHIDALIEDRETASEVRSAEKEGRAAVTGGGDVIAAICAQMAREIKEAIGKAQMPVSGGKSSNAEQG